MEKKDVKAQGELKFFFFDIESTNLHFQDMKQAMSRGHYIKAKNIADFLVENHNNPRRKKGKLTREELCLCEIARGIFFFRKGNYSKSLSSFGSASGLSQSDMKIKAEILLALVNTYDCNFKEARRRLKEINAIILLKESMNRTESTKVLRYEYQIVRDIFDSRCRTSVAENEQRIQKTNKLFAVTFAA